MQPHFPDLGIEKKRGTGIATEHIPLVHIPVDALRATRPLQRHSSPFGHFQSDSQVVASRVSAMATRRPSCPAPGSLLQDCLLEAPLPLDQAHAPTPAAPHAGQAAPAEHCCPQHLPCAGSPQYPLQCPPSPLGLPTVATPAVCTILSEAFLWRGTLLSTQQDRLENQRPCWPPRQWPLKQRLESWCKQANFLIPRTR